MIQQNKMNIKYISIQLMTYCNRHIPAHSRHCNDIHYNTEDRDINNTSEMGLSLSFTQNNSSFDEETEPKQIKQKSNKQSNDQPTNELSTV